MIQDHGAVVAPVKHGVFEHRLRLVVLTQKVEDPTVSVEISGVVRLFLDGLLAHVPGLFQALPLDRQIVGVIVQGGAIVRVELQRFLVVVESLFLVSHLVVHVPDVGEGRDGDGGVLRRYLNHLQAVVDDSLTILLVVAGGVLHLEEACLSGESGQGAVGGGDEPVPVARVAEYLDIGPGGLEALGKELHILSHQGLGLVEPLGGVVIDPGGLERLAVGGMPEGHRLVERVDPREEILDETRLRPLEKKTQVLALGPRLSLGVIHELSQGLEEAVVVSPDAVHLRLAKQGGHVIRLNVKGFLVISKGDGVLVLGQGMVPELGKDVGGGIFLIIILKDFQGLLGLVLPEQDVVLRPRHALALPEDGLDLVHGRDRLVELVLLKVEVGEGEIDVVLLRELLQQILVGGDGQVVLPGHRVRQGEPVLVPIVPRVQLGGLFQGLLGPFDIPRVEVAKTEIVPGGVVGGIVLKDGVQQPGGPVNLTLPDGSHRVDQHAVVDRGRLDILGKSLSRRYGGQEYERRYYSSDQSHLKQSG